MKPLLIRVTCFVMSDLELLADGSQTQRHFREVPLAAVVEGMAFVASPRLQQVAYLPFCVMTGSIPDRTSRDKWHLMKCPSVSSTIGGI